MKIRFEIEYYIAAEEVVYINIDDSRYPLATSNGYIWKIEVECKKDVLEYSYAIYMGEELQRCECGHHSVGLRSKISTLQIFDRWQDMPLDRSLYSSLFTKVIFNRSETQDIQPQSNGVTFVVEAPYVKPDEELIMVGEVQQLGSWDINRAVRLIRTDGASWSTPSLKPFAGEYKFAIDTGDEIIWERCDNRYADISLHSIEASAVVRVESPQFDRVAWRGSGVAIPVFSLRSRESMGVGDFIDLKRFVDWAQSVGQRVIQVLPINDTTMFNTWEDSYPYNANSSFALHPQYIAPLQVGEIQDKDKLAEFVEEGKRLNALPKIDYIGVNKLKREYLKILYSEIGSETLSSCEFKKFYKANEEWLKPYALFCYLRDKYKTPYSEKWGGEALFSEALLEGYTSPTSSDYAEIAYHYFIQYHLHVQLLEAKEYAASRGVAFKGDVPIGVSRTSVDVWVNPRLFRLDSQAGAPPDDFSEMGQNWGFPTYNWAEMAKDGYAWWMARFKKMAEYFDAYRIDHILGFFRIWEIPTDAVHGLLGFFNPSQPFTREQIESYGFSFKADYATPFIEDWTLRTTFGNNSEDVKCEYLTSCDHDSSRYRLKDEYNTQVKIAALDIDSKIKEGLMSLLDEVLFLEDRYEKGLYHPRIAAYNSLVFGILNDSERDSYMFLYNDFYYYRHNDFWKGSAEEKLPQLIAATNMLTCGEDLGMIPHTVPEVMASEQILSLEIQRMPKESWRKFGDTAAYPYRSVCTTSTHDMNPIRAWWSEDKEVTQEYYNCVLGFDGVAPAECEEYVCDKIVELHLFSPAMWTILPLQDWLSIDSNVRYANALDERINIPANSRHYWQYRMHLTIEELIGDHDLNQKIRLILKRSGR